ncbi:MAG: hypothetical protein KQH63_04695 [Desulfobulbaceae bacterium]|nr:hypothetical protein [Desulfobulbaceae bacterium]
MTQTRRLHNIIIFLIGLFIISPGAAHGLSWCQHNDSRVGGHFVAENDSANNSHTAHDSYEHSDTAVGSFDIELHCHECIHIPVSLKFLSEPSVHSSTRILSICSSAPVTADNAFSLPATGIAAWQFSQGFHLPNPQLAALRTLVLLI